MAAEGKSLQKDYLNLYTSRPYGGYGSINLPAALESALNSAIDVSSVF